MQVHLCKHIHVYKDSYFFATSKQAVRYVLSFATFWCGKLASNKVLQPNKIFQYIMSVR